MGRYLSSLISGVKCQCSLGQLQLRKCTGQKDRAVLTAGAALAHQENYILATLQCGRDTVKVILGVDRLLVDLEDDVAAAQASVICERAGLNVLYDHALAGGNIQPIGDV